MSGINIRKQCLEQANHMLQDHIIALQGTRHESTQSIAQKSLTDHKPKRVRRYDDTHVNIASFVNRFRLGRKLDMAKQSYVGMFASSMHSPQGIALQTKHTPSKKTCSRS